MKGGFHSNQTTGGLREKNTERVEFLIHIQAVSMGRQTMLLKKRFHKARKKRVERGKRSKRLYLESAMSKYSL